MVRRWIVSSAIGAVAFGLAAGSAALAQTSTTSGTTSTQTTSTTTGAFDKLSPGNQKIATALYQAQTTGTTSTKGTTGTTSTTTPLTLDEIAAKKQSGEGWGQVFKDMKAQGLVQEKNLGQVVSKSHRSTRGVVTTASGRQMTNHDSQQTAQSDGSRGHGKNGYGNSDNNSGRGHSYGSGSDSSRGNSGHGGGRGGK